ncbi:hypothetical protein D3C72_2543690 [compost metagenome]
MLIVFALPGFRGADLTGPGSPIYKERRLAFSMRASWPNGRMVAVSSAETGFSAAVFGMGSQVENHQTARNFCEL